VNSAGTYSVTVTDLHGCTAFSAPVTTTIIPLPEAPGSVSTSWITPTSFDLSWAYTAGVVPVNYTVEVSTNSSFIGGGIAGSPFTVIYPVTSLSLSGLPENTEYFFRIKANSVSCPSAYSAGSVSTLCAPSMAPFTEDFETPSFVPACWANVAVYGSGLWSRSTAASANGYGHASALANFYDQASGTYELKTKPFNISGLTTPTLKFNYAYATYVVENDELDVYYSTNFGATWTALLLMPGGPNGVLNTGGASEYTYVPTASQWCTQSIELPAGTNMVKFTAISAFGNNLYLDNISVANTAAEFSTVQNITVAGSEHYEATNAIDVAGGGSYFTVPSGASATFVAGTRISFLPGTTVQSGGYMLGHIATDPVCSNTSPTGPAILNGYQSHDTQGSVNFTLYPNPTSGNFTIVQKGDKQSGTVHVEIYSMRGEKLVSDSMIGEKMHDFNLEGFPAGLYFVKIIAEDYTETIKLVKTR
jgi:hypothetical protein